MTQTDSTALILSEVYPPRIGGSGHWLHEIYSRQPASRTVLLVGEHKDAGEFDQQSPMQIHRANLVTAAWTFMKPGGIAFFARIIRRVMKLHRRFRFSEIHCGRVMPEGVAGLAASRLLGTKLVCFIHGEDIEISRDSREHRWMTQMVLSRADRLVCNCEHSRSLLLNSWQCNEDNVRVLNPGTDTELFRPLENRDAGQQALGWTGRKVVLTVSRLDDRKGHDKLIEALPAIIAKVPETLYVIVGGGMHETYGLRLQQLVKERGLEDHVTFMGICDIDTLVSCYQCCDLFVLPNRQIGGNLEGFGIVLLEAQACGRPVIAGDSGGTAETMLPGISGQLVDCEIAENLIEPVSSLLQDPALQESMGNAGRQHMLENFSWLTLAERAANAVFVDPLLPSD